MQPDVKLLTTVAALGAAIGLGQLLSSGSQLTWRMILGRCLVNGGLGMCAGAATLMFPGLSFAASVGLACVLSSLGTSALEVFVKRGLGK